MTPSKRAAPDFCGFDCDFCWEELSRKDLKKYPLFYSARCAVDVDAQPACKRFCGARGRQDRVAADLLEEYLVCFHAALGCGLADYEAAVRCCADSAMWVAMATGIPLLYDSVMSEVKTMPIAVLAIATIFLNHLRASWFSIENARLEQAYRELREEFGNQKTLRQLAAVDSSSQSSEDLPSPT